MFGPLWEGDAAAGRLVGDPVRWSGREADGREQLGWRGTALLLFGRRWGRMEKRPSDRNERVRGFCSVKEKRWLLFGLGRML